MCTEFDGVNSCCGMALPFLAIGGSAVRLSVTDAYRQQAREGTKCAAAAKAAEINRRRNKGSIASALHSSIKDNIGLAVVIGLVLIYVAFSVLHS